MKKRFYFYPKSKLGKISLWFVISPIILIYINYWIAMAFKISTPPVSGILLIAIIIFFGILSFISLIRKDYAISLIITSILGLLAILLVIAEIIFPH